MGREREGHKSLTIIAIFLLLTVAAQMDSCIHSSIILSTHTDSTNLVENFLVLVGADITEIRNILLLQHGDHEEEGDGGGNDDQHHKEGGDLFEGKGHPGRGPGRGPPPAAHHRSPSRGGRATLEKQEDLRRHHGLI